jgi:hypothetical protein
MRAKVILFFGNNHFLPPLKTGFKQRIRILEKRVKKPLSLRFCSKNGYCYHPVQNG